GEEPDAPGQRWSDAGPWQGRLQRLLSRWVRAGAFRLRGSDHHFDTQAWVLKRGFRRRRPQAAALRRRRWAGHPATSGTLPAAPANPPRKGVSLPRALISIDSQIIAGAF